MGQKWFKKEIFQMQLEACVELAKIYEHRLKNLEKAIEFTEMALTKDFQMKKRNNEKLIKRINRLKQTNSL